MIKPEILKSWARKASLLVAASACLGWLLLAAGACKRSMNSRAEIEDLIRKGDAAFQQGRTADAEKTFRAVVGLAEKNAAASPSSTEARRDLSVSLEKLSDIAQAQGNLPEAEKLFRRGLEIREALAKANPTNAEARRDLNPSWSR